MVLLEHITDPVPTKFYPWNFYMVVSKVKNQHLNLW